MRVTRWDQKATTAPFILTVGVWDPLSKHHLNLFKTLSCHAREQSLSSLVITLDPAPGSFAYSDADWATYTDLAWRQEAQRQCGIDCVTTVALDRAETNKSAHYFLTSLCQHFSIAELWLGARQTFGRFHPSSRSAIESSCARLKIELKILDDVTAHPIKGAVRKLIGNGYVAEAIKVVGTPPIWHKPNTGVLKLSWPPGAYRASPWRSNLSIGEEDIMKGLISSSNEVRLYEGVGRSWLPWPGNSLDWIAFICGPSDNPLSSERVGNYPGCDLARNEQ